MRYNERELLSLARQPAEKAAEVLMRVPKKGSVLKKRLVKLVVNFLFYFRTDEAEYGSRLPKPGRGTLASYPSDTVKALRGEKERCQLHHTQMAHVGAWNESFKHNHCPSTAKDGLCNVYL